VLKDHFWMNPFAKHFSAMKASDLVLVDADGYVTEGGAQLPINEAGFMIHSEIHKARPDVMAAAHTHGVYGKTWSVFGKPVEMLSQGKHSLLLLVGCVGMGYVGLIQELSRRLQLLRKIKCLRGPRRRCPGGG
jgi:ribulose-5-phosphate 4-epimerase/fuculose-1-phosphate aldolase